MDGNRRWAEGRGLTGLEGHRAGTNVFFRVSQEWAKKMNIPNVVIYAFSTENWQRSPEEVAYLLELFRVMMREQFSKIARSGVRICFVGERERFPNDMQEEMRHLEDISGKQFEGTIYVALSYGGRAEILAGVNKLLAQKKDTVTEEEFSDALWTKGMPDPDLIIRTGGDMRLSGFLTWQSVYSELFFTKTLWPDFSEQEFESIVQEFYTRKRRYGK